MTQIITGLHIDVPSDELKGLLLARLKYHEAKVEFYSKQFEELRKVDVAMAADAETFSKTSNRSPSESLEQAVKKHKDQAIYYKFVAEHLVVGATYRLDEHALVKIGVQASLY
mgnify:FL=1